MQIDIAILVILAIFIILGFKNGFVHNVFFTLGWLIAFIVAFFTRDQVRGFLTDHTPVYDWYHGHIYDICLKLVSGYTDKFTDAASGPGGLGAPGVETTGGALGSAVEAIGGISGALGDAVGSIGSKIAQETAAQITSATFGVFTFIGTVLIVKFLLFLITLVLSRKYHGGFIGALDAVGGLLLGVAQGFVVVFIALILVLPVSLAISPDLFESASRALDTSFIAKTLFLNNPLIPLIDGFAPGLFDPAAWIDKLG
jgi:uncharacterized membrane protein required for colicin V production